MASYQQVGIILNLVDVTGAKIGQGSAKIQPSVQLTDAADNLEVPTAAAWAAFNGVAFPSVTVYATDSAGLLPSGWGLEISYPGVPGYPASQTFLAPAGPLSFTATNGSPCVFTWTPTSGFTVMPDSTAVQLSGGPLPAGFSAGTTYYVVNASAFTFSLAAAVNGTPLASTGSGSGTLTVTQYYLSSLTPVSSVTSMAAYMPLPSGTAASGQVPAAIGVGAGSAWASVPVNPMTTSGDTVYGGTAGAFTRLAGDTSNTRKFYREQSAGGVAQPPAWDTIQAGDVPTLNQSTTGNAATATNLAGGATLPAYVAPKVVTLTDGSNVAVDASAGNVFDWPLGGSPHTLAAPSNAVDGDVIVLRIGYSGSFTPLFNAIYDFNGSPPAWTAASGKEDEAAFRYRAASSKWRYQGSMLGFTS